MTTRIQKWGNSLAVRLPKVVAEHFQLRPGSAVRILPRSEHIVIKPSSEKSATLKDLVRKITPENRHGEVRWGKPVGREAW